MSNRTSSMRFTVGTLLRHAMDAGVPVRVLVEGAWVEGVPLATDEAGVLLVSAEHQSLVRLASVSAVSLRRSHAEDVMGEEGTTAHPRAGYPAPRLAADDHPEVDLVSRTESDPLLR